MRADSGSDTGRSRASGLRVSHSGCSLGSATGTQCTSHNRHRYKICANLYLWCTSTLPAGLVISRKNMVPWGTMQAHEIVRIRINHKRSTCFTAGCRSLPSTASEQWIGQKTDQSLAYKVKGAPVLLVPVLYCNLFRHTQSCLAS